MSAKNKILSRLTFGLFGAEPEQPRSRVFLVTDPEIRGTILNLMQTRELRGSHAMAALGRDFNQLQRAHRSQVDETQQARQTIFDFLGWTAAEYLPSPSGSGFSGAPHADVRLKDGHIFAIVPDAAFYREYFSGPAGNWHDRAAADNFVAELAAWQPPAGVVEVDKTLFGTDPYGFLSGGGVPDEELKKCGIAPALGPAAFRKPAR